jgi:hypothetical protein
MIAALLSPRVLIGLAIVAGVGVAYVKGRSDGAAPVVAKLERERAGWQTERARAAELALDWEQTARAAEAKARQTENTWHAAARAIDQDGANHAETLRAAAGRADAAVVGLRSQLGAFVAESARSAEAGASAADAQQRAAAAEAARVLAELLARCHERGAARARYADEAAAAGERCERWGDAIAR